MQHIYYVGRWEGGVEYITVTWPIVFITQHQPLFNKTFLGWSEPQMSTSKKPFPP